MKRHYPLKSPYQSAIVLEEGPRKALVCPYCGNELAEERNICCKEADRGEWVLLNPEGERVNELNELIE